jgi:hypothetical protein
MRGIIGFFAATCTTMALSQAALAQTPSEEACALCRAMAHFTTCRQPLDGARTFTGTVVGVENGRCSQLLSVQVHRASEVRMPSLAQIDLGQCAIWAGKRGDVIDLAVFEAPRPGDNVHTLACRLW